MIRRYLRSLWLWFKGREIESRLVALGVDKIEIERQIDKDLALLQRLGLIEKNGDLYKATPKAFSMDPIEKERMIERALQEEGRPLT